MRRKTTPPDRLSRDVAAAHAAGMSYGKWKALHPHTPEEAEPEPEEIILDDGRKDMTCLRCGKHFIAYGQEMRRKYCSDECRQQAQYAAFREKHPQPVISCALCGREFPKFGTKTYCGDACRMAANRKKQAERNALRSQQRKEKRNA